jgi:hypothetical protein
MHGIVTAITAVEPHPSYLAMIDSGSQHAREPILSLKEKYILCNDEGLAGIPRMLQLMIDARGHESIR